MPKIGERLRELREAKHIKQRQLATKMGHPQAWISNRELGKVTVEVDEAKEIIEAMGYAVDLVVLDGRQAHLLELLSAITPEQATHVLRLLELLPRLSDEKRDFLLHMIASTEGMTEDKDDSSDERLNSRNAQPLP